MTETSPLASVAGAPATRRDGVAAAGHAGRVVAGVQARIVDDAGVEQPWDGESVGEIQVRGPWITERYWAGHRGGGLRRRWLPTGDVGTISADAFITLTDRART